MIGAGLGAHVGRVIVEHDGGGRRTDLDDRTPVSHHLDHLLEKLEWSDELQGGHLPKLFGRGFQKRLEQTPARGVDRNRDGSHFLQCGSGQCADVIGFGDVAGHRMPANFGRKPLQFIHFAACHHHLRAFGAKAPGDDLRHVVLSGGAEYDGRFVR